MGYRNLILVVLLLGLAAGCATTSHSPDGDDKGGGEATGGASEKDLTVNGAEFETLGEFMRSIGSNREAGGVVLVSGLEERPAPAVELRSVSFDKGISRIASATNLISQDLGYFHFVFPSGYESLLDVPGHTQLAARYGETRASLVLGAGTEMYNALVLLSETLGITVIADNAIADTWCGELSIGEAPVEVILEALLMSARVVPEATVVESEKSYIFLRSSANMSRPDTCLNRPSLSPKAAGSLSREVTVRLPEGGESLQYQVGSVPLHTVVPVLQRQLGVTVSVPPAMAEFPVNPASFFELPVSDILDLLIRQWPVSGPGYYADDEGIRLVPGGRS